MLPYLKHKLLKTVRCFAHSSHPVYARRNSA